MHRHILILLALFFLFSSPALSAGREVDSYRCGGGLVEVGDHKLTVAEACGEPHYKETESVYEGINTEYWYYKQAGKFPRMLTFQRSRLIKIEILTDQ